MNQHLLYIFCTYQVRLVRSFHAYSANKNERFKRQTRLDCLWLLRELFIFFCCCRCYFLDCIPSRRHSTLKLTCNLNSEHIFEIISLDLWFKCGHYAIEEGKVLDFCVFKWRLCSPWRTRKILTGVNFS